AFVSFVFGCLLVFVLMRMELQCSTMRPSRFPTFLLGLIIGLIIVPISVYCYFRFGFAPVATGAAAMPFEKTFAKMGLHAKMNKEYPRNAPIQGSPEN